MKRTLSNTWRRYAVLLFTGVVLVSGCSASQKATADTGSASDTGTQTSVSTSTAVDTKTDDNLSDTADSEKKETTAKSTVDESSSTYASEKESLQEAPVIEGLTCTSKMELSYAEGFDVYYYSDDYKVIAVHDSADYLLVPEGKEAPEKLPAACTVLQQPLDRIYLAATSAMALFDSMGALDQIKMTGTDASGWYIDDAVQALNDGSIIYAGKYSEPDYEMLIDQDCDLAIESTMILHVPKVQEMIETLGIPVFIDRSSYESHPLGRTEWIKAYAAMVNKEDTANAFFDEQAKVIDQLKDFKNTEKTIAFFYVSTDGSVVVRKSTDYIPRMIELAGGRYLFDSSVDEATTQTSVPMTMEQFYATAVDADYLVYNASIDATVTSIDTLLAKSALFADFKAVKEGNVWTTGKSLYQATDIVGELITDMNLMLTDGDESQMTFLTHIQ